MKVTALTLLILLASTCFQECYSSTTISMTLPISSCSPTPMDFECSTVDCNWFCITKDSTCLDYYIVSGVVLLVVSISLNILYVILIIACKFMRRKRREDSRSNGGNPRSCSCDRIAQQRDQRNMLEFQYMPPERTLDVYDHEKHELNKQADHCGGCGHSQQQQHQQIPPHPDHHVNQQPLPNGKFKSSYDMISARYIDDQCERCTSGNNCMTHGTATPY